MRIKKYATAFMLNIEQQMQRRASLIMERIRSLALVLSLYFLWTSLLADPTKKFLGYTHQQMLTYVLGLALLRALVIANRAFEFTWEIAQGRISFLLMRPLNLFVYQFSLDLSDKMIRLLAAIFEVGILVLVFRASLYVPQHISSGLLALLACVLALILYFFIGLALASSGFWSSESIGFLWAASLLIEFASGAFFPLDVLPKAISKILYALPFPYLVYFPINIYLERMPKDEIWKGLLIQTSWLCGFYVFVKALWSLGLKNYQAEGG